MVMPFAIFSTKKSFVLTSNTDQLFSGIDIRHPSMTIKTSSVSGWSYHTNSPSTFTNLN